jgi:hypothetical protein
VPEILAKAQYKWEDFVWSKVSSFEQVIFSTERILKNSLYWDFSQSFFSFTFSFFMVATVYIVIYSLYGHVYTLAQEVQKGLEASGVQTKLFQGMSRKALYIFSTRTDLVH